MSPAQLLFGRALVDFLPMNPEAYQLHPYWGEQVKKSLEIRKSHQKKMIERYNFGTRSLKTLRVNQRVLVQDQTGRSKRWNRYGVIVSCLPYRKYRVRLQDTGNITVRNRRFLKPTSLVSQQVGPYSGPSSGPKVARSNLTKHQHPPVLEEESSVPQTSHQPVNNPTQPSTQSSPISSQPQPTLPTSHREKLMVRRLHPFNRPGLKE